MTLSYIKRRLEAKSKQNNLASNKRVKIEPTESVSCSTNSPMEEVEDKTHKLQKYHFSRPPSGTIRPVKMKCPRSECGKEQPSGQVRFVQVENGEWSVVAWPHSCKDGKGGIYRPQWKEGAEGQVLSHTTALIQKKKEQQKQTSKADDATPAAKEKEEEETAKAAAQEKEEEEETAEVAVKEKKKKSQMDESPEMEKYALGEEFVEDGEDTETEEEPDEELDEESEEEEEQIIESIPASAPIPLLEVDDGPDKSQKYSKLTDPLGSKAKKDSIHHAFGDALKPYGTVMDMVTDLATIVREAVASASSSPQKSENACKLAHVLLKQTLPALRLNVLVEGDMIVCYICGKGSHSGGQRLVQCASPQHFCGFWYHLGCQGKTSAPEHYRCNTCSQNLRPSHVYVPLSSENRSAPKKGLMKVQLKDGTSQWIKYSLRKNGVFPDSAKLSINSSSTTYKSHINNGRIIEQKEVQYKPRPESGVTHSSLPLLTAPAVSIAAPTPTPITSAPLDLTTPLPRIARGGGFPRKAGTKRDAPHPSTIMPKAQSASESSTEASCPEQARPHQRKRQRTAQPDTAQFVAQSLPKSATRTFPPAQRMPQVHQAQKLSSKDRESLKNTKKLLEERAAIRRLEEKQDALLAQNIAKIEVRHAFIFVCIDT